MALLEFFFGCLNFGQGCIVNPDAIELTIGARFALRLTC
jgi:hypothetical protein